MCGTLLGQVLQSQAFVGSTTPPQPFSPPSQLSKENNGHQHRPQLKLLHPSGQSFLLLKEAGVIGRQNQANGTRPEIDVTGLAHASIVSRSHAYLYWDNSQQTYMVIDDSRNGSYLNGKLLARGAPHPLKKGDELQLGQEQLIRLQVELS